MGLPIDECLAEFPQIKAGSIWRHHKNRHEYVIVDLPVNFLTSETMVAYQRRHETDSPVFIHTFINFRRRNEYDYPRFKWITQDKAPASITWPFSALLPVGDELIHTSSNVTYTIVGIGYDAEADDFASVYLIKEKGCPGARMKAIKHKDLFTTNDRGVPRFTMLIGKK